MKNLNVLIAEDNRSSRETIKRGIEKFNIESLHFQITTIMEVSSFEEYDAVFRSSTIPIDLVFLDIDLDGDETAGLRICEAHPDMAYIVVSKDPYASKKISNKTKAHSYYYIEKVSEGAFSRNEVASAIAKFLDEKGSDFYKDIIELGRKEVIVPQIAFISKYPIKVDIDRGQRVLLPCSEICMRSAEHSTASQYILTNRIDSAMDHPCLMRLYKSKNQEGRSIRGFVEEHSLDPSLFVKISASTIINLYYVDVVKESNLYVRMSDGKSAIFSSGSTYLTPDVKAKIAKIRRFKITV